MSTVSIRFYELTDAPVMYAAAKESVAEVQPWLPWCHDNYTLDEATTWIKTQIEARERGSAFEFVTNDEDGQFLGGCGVNQISQVHRMANLGYWVRSAKAGRGIAEAAVRAAADWAFANTHLERLEIVVAVDNVRSQRVAEKAGALHEGALRSRLFLHGRHHDAVMYSIVRASWAPMNALAADERISHPPRGQRSIL